MGTNMYPSSFLFGHDRDENEALPLDELIEQADGFAGVFPGNYLYSMRFFKRLLGTTRLLESSYLSNHIANKDRCLGGPIPLYLANFLRWNYEMIRTQV